MSVLQSKTALITGTGGNLTINGVQAGSALVAISSMYRIGSGGATPPTAPTDTNGVSPLTVGDVPNFLTGFGGGGLDSAGSSIWHKFNAEAGSHTVGISIAFGGGDCQFTLLEVSDMNAGLEWAQADGLVNGDQTRSSGTTGNVSQTNAVAIVAITIGASTGVSNANITNPPAGYVSLAYNGNTASQVGAEHAYDAGLSPGTQGVVWTWTDATTSVSQGIIAVYKNTIDTSAKLATWGQFDGQLDALSWF